MENLKFIFRYIRTYLLPYILGLVILFIVDYLNTVIPEFVGRVTDGLDSNTMDMDSVLSLCIKIALVGAALATGRVGWRFCLHGSARSIERDLRNDMFRHLETLSSQYFIHHKTGDLMAHFTNDLMSVRVLLGQTVVTAFDATVMLIMVMYKMMVYVDVSLTLVATIPMILIIIGNFFYGKEMHKRFLAKQKSFSNLTDQVQESVSGIRVIKSFVEERRELKEFLKVNDDNREKNLRVARLRSWFIPVLDAIVGCSTLLTLLYGGYLAIYGKISVGQFVAFNSYVSMLVWPLLAAGECVTAISQGLASVGRIKTIFDAEADIADSALTDTSITELQGHIEFKDLTFHYPEGHGEVLSNINLEIPAGSTLAVIGRTGCGKTTLANLLVRIYDAPEGSILLDGHPITHIPLTVLRQDIAYVPQDNFLFSDTIAHNIAFGVTETTMDEIQEAAKVACVDDNIIAFPDGYETMVGERGVTLSGGQKQRSSIARALLKDSPILILDDSLSAVDTDTEERILENLDALRQGKTTIIIAHRISTIQNADRILVLDEGRQVEYGTHDSLMKLNGIYRNLFENQQLEKEGE